MCKYIAAVIFLMCVCSGWGQNSIFPYKIKFAEIFTKYPDGAIAIYDLNNDILLQYRPARCIQQYIPASTFKIPHSLIALETGVIKDEEQVFFRWDGTKYPISSWENDHNLATAFQHSVVPFHIKIAQTVGAEKEQEFVSKFNYGNQKASGGKTAFWLDGDIRISINEQIEFLKRLYHQELPISPRSITIVKKIMIREQTEDYVLRGKTGWGKIGGKNCGWFVGYLEQNSNVYFFATNIISKRQSGFSQDRINITKQVFLAMGLLKR